MSFDNNTTTTNGTPNGSFLWLSDLHLDPYYGTEQANGENCTSASEFSACGQIGCDSPQALLDGALSTVASLGRSPDFVLVSGDWARHSMDKLQDPQTSMMNILQTIHQSLASTTSSPSSLVIPTLGNNDVIPDYYLDVANATESLDLFIQGLDNVFVSDEERSTFRKGGYLARRVSDKLTVLSLNTVIYASHHIPPSVEVDDPLDQFAWLAERLQEARDNNRHVYIVAHVPPTVGSHRKTQLWEGKYITTYFSLLQPYATSVVMGQLFGHLHSDEVRIIQNQFPLLLAPSLTPIYDGNPSFRYMEYNTESGVPLNYRTYYLPLTLPHNNCSSAAWVESPSFAETFGLSDLSFSAWQSWMQDLEENVDVPMDPHWQAFLARHRVYFQDALAVQACMDVECRREWLCTMTSTDSQEYETCVRRSTTTVNHNSFPKLKTWLPILSTLVFLMLVVFAFLCFRRRKRQSQQNYHTPKEEPHQEDAISLPNVT